ncbi:Cytochrome b561/ferric reductase transmembrane [Plasmopara halstedii]|uniref:Cytochrome b561/ferric reductase transmembrane n=1 Tax=Plasmopara halstedii TaxID=4781 RepID=A0A0P1B5P2_PLAHL|nr:Cytochrome b561/ferric reductase transmembrane [Plasmopara halstedii]CEG49000.1 Cytochrome b561/ferric reductase transmembrane [Plasmopara halstedii]|eukprot:XP_024585369.1 Cytochrome b561/ferric reductase transmembrane [Plasmopara halstedii]
MGDLALTAALFLLPCGIIIKRCIADGSLFSLHPLLNAVAMLVCFPSALQVMLQRKYETNHLTRVWLTKLHLFLNVSAGVLMSAAGIVAFITKHDTGNEHLATPHSWAAVWSDDTHALTGVLIYVGSVLTMLYGLHTSSWGVQNLSSTLQFQLTMLIIAAHVTLLYKALKLQRRKGIEQLKMAKMA